MIAGIRSTEEIGPDNEDLPLQRAIAFLHFARHQPVGEVREEAIQEARRALATSLERAAAIPAKNGRNGMARDLTQVAKRVLEAHFNEVAVELEAGTDVAHARTALAKLDEIEKSAIAKKEGSSPTYVILHARALIRNERVADAVEYLRRTAEVADTPDRLFHALALDIESSNLDPVELDRRVADAVEPR